MAGFARVFFLQRTAFDRRLSCGDEYIFGLKSFVNRCESDILGNQEQWHNYAYYA